MTIATRLYSDTWVLPADVAVMRSFEPGHVPPRSQSHIVDSPVEHRYHDIPDSPYRQNGYTVKDCPECKRVKAVARLRRDLAYAVRDKQLPFPQGSEPVYKPKVCANGTPPFEKPHAQRHDQQLCLWIAAAYNSYKYDFYRPNEDACKEAERMHLAHLAYVPSITYVLDDEDVAWTVGTRYEARGKRLAANRERLARAAAKIAYDAEYRRYSEDCDAYYQLGQDLGWDAVQGLRPASTPPQKPDIIKSKRELQGVR